MIDLNGKYPAIPALQDGVKGYNNKETPCRKAPPFRAESFKKYFGIGCMAFCLWLGFCQTGWAAERYTVKSGDTLSAIAVKFGVELEALKKANAIKGDSIKPRQILTIPSLDKRPKESVSVTPVLKKNTTQIVRTTPETTESYVVSKGDSLYTISRRTGYSIEEIKEINHLRSSTLTIGKILLIPKEGNQQDEAEDLEAGEETAEDPPLEAETEESLPSAPLGKWGSVEERDLFVRVTKSFLGTPYKYGGSTLRGIDCSAFVQKVYEIFNVHLPRTTREQIGAGKKVEKEQLEEGDLVFFKRSGNRAHVGIYIGENQFVHASSYNREIKIDHLDLPYYTQRFLRGVRVKELETGSHAQETPKEGGV